MSTQAAAELTSPTTGEPIEVVARRNTLGGLLLIVADVAGTVVLVLAYFYLLYLNTNNSWLPEGKDSLWNTTGMNVKWPGTVEPAPEWPFWAIAAGVVLSALVFWAGVRALKRGNTKVMIAAAGVVALGFLALVVAQFLQVRFFTFTPTAGGYASVLHIIGISNFLHYLLSAFVVLGIWNRTRLGRVTPRNPFQANIVGIWLTWIAISTVVLALLTFFVASPNADPSIFGTFGPSVFNTFGS
jgi:heme/copper-type cytochrome/quinol oxidase subunit 3